MFAQLLPLQTIWPAAHELLHAPVEHTRPPVHALPQVPQFVPSACAFTQTPLQFVRLPEQTHAPAEHVWPWPHVLPHAPQLALSIVTSTHAGPQPTRFAGQPVLRMPAVPEPPVPLRPPAGGS